MGFIDELKFEANGLIPAIIQDYKTNEVLMMAYMNREAIEKSIATGKTFFWSRSRQRLRQKGETSNNFQYIKTIAFDCDKDTLLIKVDQAAGACQTGRKSCFFRGVRIDDVETIVEDDALYIPVDSQGSKAGILDEIYDTVVDRTINRRQGSYTNFLLEKGLDAILKKIGEEASEVIIAAKNGSRAEVRSEVADLLYHIIIMLVEKGVNLEEIYDELISALR